MSGIYIPWMSMPKTCDDCQVSADCPNDEHIDGYKMQERPRFCQLYPVPEHGRLGDLDELFKRMFVGPDGQRYPDKDVDGWDHAYTFRGIKHEILSAPTIIPADPPKGE